MNKYFSKSLISYFIAFIFVFISIKLCWKPEYYELIKNIKITHLSIVILITFVLNVIAGVSMSHISKTQYNIRLDSLDKIALSLMMNFWGYIIPLKGGVLFSAFYLKSKYNIKLVEGTSIAIFIYIVNLTIFGKIDATGMTFAALKPLIEQTIAAGYPRSLPAVTITSVGVFQVPILGEMPQSRYVTAWGLSRLSEVLEGNLGEL